MPEYNLVVLFDDRSWEIEAIEAESPEDAQAIADATMKSLAADTPVTLYFIANSGEPTDA